MQNRSNLLPISGFKGKNTSQMTSNATYSQKSLLDSNVQIPLPNLGQKKKRIRTRRRGNKTFLTEQSNAREFEDNPFFISFEDPKEEHFKSTKETPSTSQKPQSSEQESKSEEKSAAEMKKEDTPGPTTPTAGSSIPTLFRRLATQSHQSLNMINANKEVISQPQLYSPTEMTMEQHNQDEQDISEHEAGQKRTSAFDRLGPVTQVKKPKLTINLSLKKDQPVREVVDLSEEPVYVPIHEREDIISSTDETVVRYLPRWPWKKQLPVKKSFTVRSSKSVMLMEKEQVMEIYAKDVYFVGVTVKGYPTSWTKEDVLDALLAKLQGKSFIPCFIDFTKEECKFLVHKSRSALLEIHALGFLIRYDDVELVITISLVYVTVNHIDFFPTIVLKRRLDLGYSGKKLDLNAFTLQKDVSHFLYYPLNHSYNQRELRQIHCNVDWVKLTELNLSHNRIDNLDGFDLPSLTPNLQSLDVSYNLIPTLPTLLSCRELPLKRLRLEGNPLCLDYLNPRNYMETVKLMFSSLRELDGETITLKGEIPEFKKNYSPEDSVPVVEKFLETFFPLLDSPDKYLIENMYAEDAIMTITLQNKIRYDPDSIRFKKYFRHMFLKSRYLDQKAYDYVYGAENIKNVIEKWPRLMHDPTTFCVDVLHHDDASTVLRITGILKIVADTLAEDEPLLAFSRTMHLHTTDQVEYRIKNEMLYWDVPTPEYADSAFKLIRIRNKKLELKFDSPPDKEIQEKLIKAFMKLTELDAKPSRRCLEVKEWHLKNALEYFIKLLKLDNLGTLYKTDES